MLDTLAAAKRIGRSPSTLKRWRRRKIGPPYVLTESGGVLYDQDKLEQWLEDRTVDA